VSSKTNSPDVDSKASTSLINPAEARPRVKKVPLLKRLIKIGFKMQKANRGSIALVWVVAVLVSLLLALGIFLFAWGGASGIMLTLVGVAGLALIVFGASRIIRSIKRKHETTQ
jgi:fatty acid desaturase